MLVIVLLVHPLQVELKEGTYYRDTQVTLTAKAAPTGYDFLLVGIGSNLVSTSLSFSLLLFNFANKLLLLNIRLRAILLMQLLRIQTKVL